MTTLESIKVIFVKYIKKLRAAYYRYLSSRWFGWCKKQQKSIYEDIMPYKNEVNLSLRVQDVISKYNGPYDQNIVIIDDSYGIVDVVKEYVEKILLSNEIFKTTGVLAVAGIHAPFVLTEVLKELELKKIDYAIIDIVLPGKMIINNQNVKFDGIDVAIHLHKNYGCTNFCFYSGNVVSEYVEFIGEKMKKFTNHFNKDLRDYIIYKGNLNETQTIQEFEALILKDKYCVDGGCKDVI